MGLRSQLKHAWNAFTNQNDEYRLNPFDMGAAYGSRPDRSRFRIPNERSIVAAIFTRVSVDVAQIDIRHVEKDEHGRYKKDHPSGLHNIFNVEANIDQGARAFKQDIVQTLFDEGTIALVPVDTNISPENGGSIEIETMRVGIIKQWYPRHVRVECYNDRTGRREEITLDKTAVGIVENPLYTVMNEPNSTLQRLIRKLNLLDTIDEQSGSGKLDMIIQLPYVIKSETRRQQAEQRRKDIEFQLKDSQYGIAYTEGTEKITQLNRPAENNLLKQVEYLTEMLYGQLGITAEVMNGTADEKAMLNYMNRTIEPILTAITEELRRKFLSKNARTRGQDVMFFKDPFKLVPMSDLAEMADKFTRNEIFTSNEIRQFVGAKPSTDPKADELRNSNMPAPLDTETGAPPTPGEEEDDDFDPYAGINEIIDKAAADLGVTV
jgi:hypothetical protein